MILDYRFAKRHDMDQQTTDMQCQSESDQATHYVRSAGLHINIFGL